MTILVGCATLVLTASACEPQTSDSQKEESKQQESISKQYVKNQPAPKESYSQLRQNLIDIETAQIKGVRTTSFFFNQGIEHPIFTCPSIGMPIPATTSLTNPDQVIQYRGEYNGGNVTVKQMEPNGVYPSDTTATYVLCVGGDGHVFGKYWEGNVDAYFAPAVWDDAKNEVRITGRASYDFSEGKGK
jgi:hypothetical protein